ncbi:VanZ family protein [Enterococcus sp. ALS3]|uniref:VanZ family protein n=1 Tax=Enterococcus alishanensis TaxID=1303817 RepID=A0ABS6T9K5_9ENTE|nr:VanZ family protein [Enterococcus alishanensis]MBV7389587.1 VanZ family protein [Enterococcus alishanensis]
MNTKRNGKILLTVYLIVLVWILLFKLALSLPGIIQSFNTQRSLNLIPFQGSTIINGKIGFLEIFYNFLIFLPFGGLLSVSSKRTSFLEKTMLMIAFSLTIEILQFILGIGASDVTDLLMNALGGIMGLLIYRLLLRSFPEIKLDKFLVMLGSVIFVLCLAFVAFIIIYNL